MTRDELSIVVEALGIREVIESFTWLDLLVSVVGAVSLWATSAVLILVAG